MSLQSKLIPLTLFCFFVCANPALAIDNTPIGYATVNGTTTGGSGGSTITVDNVPDFVTQISRPEPLTILVKGTLDLGLLPDSPRVNSDKTIIGIGSDAIIKNHGLVLWGVHNIIIRNLIFSHNYPDSLTIAWGTNHVWIDHNEFYSDKGVKKDPADLTKTYYDGLIDITHGPEYISISWNKIHTHDKVSLVGLENEAEEYGHLQVTYYNNWFDNNVQRNPRLSFGRVHLLNNYYSNISSYAAGSFFKGQIYAEGNVFENVTIPLISRSPLPPPNNVNGYITDINNLYINSGSNDISGATSWRPDTYYSYSVTPANQIKNLVTKYSGVGQLQSSTAGDLNSDGIVNQLDTKLLITNFKNPYSIYDFNKLVANFTN